MLPINIVPKPSMPIECLDLVLELYVVFSIMVIIAMMEDGAPIFLRGLWIYTTKEREAC